MHVLAGVLIVVGLASLSSCRTQHTASDVSEPEADVALVSPRQVPTLAQLIPILEGPESPELKLRKLRKLIPIYDDLTKWRIDHNERLVKILPFKNKAKPLAFILAGNDYMKLKKPDPIENNPKEYDYKNSDNSVNSKHDNDIRRKGISDKESSDTKLTKTHTKSESRNSYNDENDKIHRIHNSGLSYKNENKNHKNKDYKSEYNSNESEYEYDEPSTESNESSNEVTESSENKSGHNKNYAKENNSENGGKKNRKEHESQKWHQKHEKSSRKSKHSDNSYNGKHEKHSREHISELRHKNQKNKNIDNSNSGSYSNEFENESNEPSNEDNKSWSKDSEDNESWNEDKESKSTKKSIEHKNESIEKISHHYNDYNKSKHLKTLNKFSIDDSPSQASTPVSEGLLSNRPYFIPHSTKPNIPLTDSNDRHYISSKSEETLTANSESNDVISSEIRTESEQSPKSVHISLESDVPEESDVEFETNDVTSRNYISESTSDSESDESQSSTELNKSRSDAPITKGSEYNSITTETDETKELPVGQFRSIFPVKDKKTIDNASDINSNDFESGTEFNGSDLGLNQSESSLKSTESPPEHDSNDIPEATSDSELAVSGSDSNSDAFESLTDEYSSKSYISNESTFDSSGTEPTHAEPTSESVSTSVSDENSDYESISEDSVSDVSKVPELDSNSSGYDSISDSESVTDGVQDVKLKEYDNVSTEKSNEFRGQSEANPNESVSYDGNKSVSDLEFKNTSYEENNELISTDASESKSNMVDSSESGLKSNSSLELADFYLARISDDNDDVGDSGVIATEKIYEKLSDESRFDNDDDRKKFDDMIKQIFGVPRNNDTVNEESTNKDDATNEKHISDDSYFDMTSADTSDSDLTEPYDKYEQDSTSTAENEDVIEVITPNEHTEAGNKEITPFVFLVDKHHHHHGHDTEAPNYKISMKEYNKYDVGDISSDNNNVESIDPVVLEDYGNINVRNTVNSTKDEDQEFTPINIVIKKHGDVDATTKNIIIKYDKNRESSIIIDACSDKQDKDSNDNEKHGDAESDNKHQNDVNTINQHNNSNNELGINRTDKWDSNSETNVSPKEKHQHKIYKLSFIFN